MNNIETILQYIALEKKRQTNGMELIPSENYVSVNVLKALGSILTNKYSEGYPGARYYGGQENIDLIESKAIELVTKLFKCNFANVQPYSGTPANLAVYNALLEPGDTILSMALDMGGHLSHGYKITLSGKIYHAINYGVKLDGPDKGFINYDQIESLAKEHKPKMIIAGGSAYPRIIDFERFSTIAKSVNALLFVDMAHIAGLVAGGAHPSPFPYADVVATTTHKTMRGPRGGVILTNNEDYAKAINKAVFPGMQGGPHDNNTAAKAICFAEALEPSFKKYAKNVVDNAKILAETINRSNLANNSIIFSGGTDNHLLLVDVTPFGISGKTAQEILDTIHITVNKQMLPGDTRKPSDPSGIRLGSPAMTTRGFGKKEFTLVGKWIVEALSNPEDIKLHKKLAKEVTALCKQFTLPH
jgi:glycine hydroxymethyltransferase